jgi:hypothetical protein
MRRINQAVRAPPKRAIGAHGEISVAAAADRIALGAMCYRNANHAGPRAVRGHKAGIESIKF